MLRALISTIFGLFLVVNTSFAQNRTSITAISVSPNNANHYAQYDITFRVTNPNGSIVAGQDSIRITFPEETRLPSQISASSISVAGVTLTGTVTVYENNLAFITPVSLGNNNSALIRILSNAKIKSPSTIGNYALSIFSSNTYTATSPSYTIVASTTTVSAAAVTPNPSVEFFPAQYTISFQLGEGGFLAQNQKIFLAFPAGTIIPDGFLSGVRVNGTNAVTLKNGNTLEVFTPSFYDNNQFIQILIPKASGIRNPEFDNSPYQIGVSTQSETSVVQSATYSISPVDQLSFSAVSPSPDTVNHAAAYEISFYTGIPGDLVAGTDIIEFTFPPNTQIPSNLNPSRITISNSEGFTDNPTSVQRISDSVIRLQTPVPIAEGSEVTVRFQSALGIRNPSEPGNYQLSARTIRQDFTEINGATSSNPYAIFATSSTIERPIVSLASTNQNTNTNYTISFKVGQFGGLSEDLNTITLKFPTGTDLSGISTATINGTTIPIARRVVSNSTTLTITIPDGVSINSNGSVNLVINTIRNPANGGYSILASTSAEPTEISSADYTIGGTTFTISSSPQVSPQSVNATAQYAIYGLNNSGQYNRNNNDYVRFSFPEGVVIPSTIAISDIQLSADAGAFIREVVTNPTNRLVTLYLDKNAGGNSSFRIYSVIFNASAGITNPAIPSTGTDNPTVNADNYRIRVSSSRNVNYATSPTFNIQPTNSQTLTINEVVVTPNVRNADNVAYSFRFTPTSEGRLQGGTTLGSNYIRLFTYGSILDIPGTINPAFVTINGVSAQRVDVANGNTITVFIPDGVTLEPNVQAELRLGSELGLRNVNYSGNPGFAMKTDNSYQQRSGSFTIQNTLNLPLTFDEISLSTNTINAPVAFTLRFKLGSNDNLSVGDLIKITFPDNTFVPSSVSRSRILVNSQNPPTNASLENTRTLVIPSPGNYASGAQITVLISTNAGLLNPSFAAANLTASILIPNGSTATSPTYVTTTTTSTVSIATVELSKDGSLNPSAPSQQADYTIRFTTGENGRLLSSGNSRSTITITFPNGTVLPSAASSSVAINGFAVPQSDRIFNNASRTATFTIPENQPISNSSPVTVFIPNITNPSTPSNSYTVQVRTSVELEPIESNPYAISNNGPVTFISAQNVSNIVNADSDYQIRFRTGTLLNQNVDRVIIEFPEDTGFKGAIPTDAIELTVFQDPGFTTISSVYSFDTSDFSISPNSNTITGLLGIDIPGGSYLEIRVNQTANIRNPREPGTGFGLKVATTQQTFRVGTNNLEFLPSSITNISNLSVERSTTNLDTPTIWTWRFTTGTNGGLRPGLGSITLRYLNASIAIPTSINTASILVNQARPNSISVNGNDVTLVIPSTVTIGSNANVEIIISSDAGIIESGGVGGSANRNTNKESLNRKSTPSPTITNTEYEAFTSAEPTSQGNNAALPVDLVSFTVKPVTKAQRATLSWTTATEIENYGFKIERNFEETEWKMIEFIRGSGFSTEPIIYTFEDNTVQLAGTYLYRLTQIDFDGTETTYPPVEVLIEAPLETELLANYPNPFNPSTTIVYQLAQQERVTLRVFDVLGRLVETIVNEKQLAGRYETSFNASRLASGIYFIRLNTEQQSFTRKIMLLK